VTALSVCLAALALWQYQAIARLAAAAFQALAGPAAVALVGRLTEPRLLLALPALTDPSWCPASSWPRSVRLVGRPRRLPLERGSPVPEACAALTPGFGTADTPVTRRAAPVW